MNINFFENIVIWRDRDLNDNNSEITQDQIDFYFLLLNYFIENWKTIKPEKMGGSFLIPMSDIERCIGYAFTAESLKADLQNIRKQSIKRDYIDADGSHKVVFSGLISSWVLDGETIGIVLPDFIRNDIESSNLDNDYFFDLKSRVELLISESLLSSKKKSRSSRSRTKAV